MMNTGKVLYLGILSWLLLWSPMIKAELTIEITQGVESATPIAIVPFAGQEKLPEQAQIAAIIQNDLQRSGYFKTLSHEDMLSQPSQPGEIKFRNWRALGQEYLLIGKISSNGMNHVIMFYLYDVYKGEQLMAYRLRTTAPKLRSSAHRISDEIFEKLTGKKGVFNTRIAYIKRTLQKSGKFRYRLQVADADGYKPITVFASDEPLMSPSWSPDGKQLAYVSFEKKYAAIYLQTLNTGKKTRISAIRGINGAPSFSPDGTKLAVTLSKDGSPDIYIIDLQSLSRTKLTRSFAIDTEPNWSPDGRHIVFTSDRGGRPQLYTIPSEGGRAKRLTFEGDYNARGVYSQDGNSIAMVHGNRGDYRIAVMELASRTINVLTAGRLDEAPSFSPNDTMILYAAQKRGNAYLAAVSADGKMHQKLQFASGNIKDPAWAPTIK